MQKMRSLWYHGCLLLWILRRSVLWINASVIGRVHMCAVALCDAHVTQHSRCILGFRLAGGLAIVADQLMLSVS